MAGSPADPFREWLANLVDTAPRGERLPTHTQLAADWGLSPTTIRKVLAEYAATGQLKCARGKGTFIAPEQGAPAQVSPAPLSSSESIAHTLSRAIGRGDLQRGDALPQVKALCLEYHVTPSTVAAAFRILEERGLVVRMGRRYWVGTVGDISAPVSWESVVFFYHGAPSLSAFLERMLWRNGLHEMEAELQSCHTRLSFLPIDQLRERWDTWRASQAFPQGVVVASEQSEYMAAVSEWLATAPVPKSVSKPRILVGGARPPKLRRGLQYFTHGHIPTMQARTIGQFCNQHRFKRLHIVVGDIGKRPTAARDSLRLIPELAAQSPQTSVRFVCEATGSIRSPADYLLALRESFSDSYLLSIAGKRRATSFEEIAQSITIVPSLKSACGEARPGDLWYFLSPRQAAAALEQFRANGTEVPAHASILTARDEPEYYHLGLSSCATDWRAIGYLMAHVLVGDLPVEKTGRGFIRTVVRVYERSSTP